jgi:hypothetical protein
MTYCVAIEKEIVVATCPLRKGSCYWQHRQTMRCMHTEDDLTPQEFVARVGLPSDAAADDVKTQVFLGKLKTALLKA